MGNYRFKISDMIPNSWLHKLKGKTAPPRNKTPKKQPITTSSSPQSPAPTPHPTKPHHRKSYYFTRDLIVPDPTLHTISPPPDPPRNSSKKKRRAPTKPSSNHRDPVTCTCPSTHTHSDPYPDTTSSGLSGSGSVHSMVSSKTSPDVEFKNIDLAPIITKPGRFGSGRWVLEGKNRSISLSTNEVRRFPGKPKVNTYSPRVGGRVRVQAIKGGRRSNGKRRSLSESFAVMKASVDPQRDFKESMVEMIMENDIKSSKDLEDLLACYLSLNSEEYHDLIIKVFKQIWFESTGVRF